MATPQNISARNLHAFFSTDSLSTNSEEHQAQSNLPHIQSRPAVQNDAWQLKNYSAARNYEVALDEKALISHHGNQQRIANVVANLREKKISTNPTASPTEFRKMIEASLEIVLIDANFDSSPYLSKTSNPSHENFIHGYGKYLLYGDDNHDAPFCLQYFHFSPGQKTPLHDHPVPCISLVVRGQLVERHYLALSTSEARKTEITSRGYYDRKSILDTNQSNIHSLKNKQNEISGSVHFYYMDGDLASRAVKTIYQKAPQNGNPLLNNVQ